MIEVKTGGILKTILVASIKGGVGKTTVAVGLAQALHRCHFKVGLLDLDWRSPSVPLLLGGIKGLVEHGPGDSIVPPSIDGLAVFSMGFIWPADKCVMMEDDEATKDVQQLLAPGALAWPPDLDFLVCDTPPTSAGLVTTALSSPGISGALLVSQPSTLAMAGLLRTLDLLIEKSTPIYGIISNQGTDEEGRPRYDLTESAVEEVTKRFHLPFFFAIRHARDLQLYFDKVAQVLLTMSPVVLQRASMPEGRWKRLVQVARGIR